MSLTLSIKNGQETSWHWMLGHIFSLVYFPSDLTFATQDYTVFKTEPDEIDTFVAIHFTCWTEKEGQNVCTPQSKVLTCSSLLIYLFVGLNVVKYKECRLHRGCKTAPNSWKKYQGHNFSVLNRNPMKLGTLVSKTGNTWSYLYLAHFTQI